jgi:phosphate-selective porin OprO/OprP
MTKGKISTRALLCTVAITSLLTAMPFSVQAAGITPDQLQVELDSLQSQIDMIRKQQHALSDATIALRARSKQQDVIARQQTLIAIQQGNVAQQQLALASRSTWSATGHDVIPTFVSADGKSTFTIGGQIALDSALGTVPRQRGFSGGTDFKHLEFDVKGTYKKHYLFKLEEDFSKTSSPLGGIVDAYLGYTTKIGGTRNVFLAGNQLTPFGFQIPSDETLFLETEMGAGLFQDGRQVGITGHTYTNRWNAWYGVSNAPAVKTPSQSTFAGNSQSTVSAVYAWNFINHPDHLVSVRNSIEFNKFNGNKLVANEPTFSISPDLSIYGNDFISTGPLNIQSDYIESPRIDIEDGRLTVAGMYYYVQTQSNAFASTPVRQKLTPSFSSWDVEAQYFLTDDYEPYSSAQGYYVAVQPRHPVTSGGLGAIQLTGRIDNANLNSQKYGIHGGNETNITLGVNWWPTKATRVNFNYVKVLPIGDSNSATNKGASANIAALRLIFIF